MAGSEQGALHRGVVARCGYCGVVLHRGADCWSPAYFDAIRAHAREGKCPADLVDVSDEPPTKVGNSARE